MEPRTTKPYVMLVFITLWASGVIASFSMAFFVPVVRQGLTEDPFSYLFGALIGGPVGWVALLYALIHPPDGPRWGSLDGNLAVLLWIICIALALGGARLIAIPLRSRERLRIAEELRRQDVARREAQRRADRIAAERSLMEIALSLSIHSAKLAEVVHQANESLDHAEHAFGEGALSPFWDKIDEATRTLAIAESTATIIAQSTKTIRQLSKDWGLSIPPLHNNIPPELAIAVDRSQSLAWHAHKDPNFSYIYTLRRGFSDLEKTLSNVKHGVIKALEILDSSITSADEAAREASSHRAEQLESIRDAFDKDGMRRSHEQR